MTFEENPFRVLRVSMYANKVAINERADELSFEDPDREETIEQARTILLNPRKRIAAEVLEIVGKDIFLDGFIFKLKYVDEKFSGKNPETILKQINSARVKAKFPAVQDTAAIKAELKNIRYEIREKIQDTFKKMNHGERVKLANDLADYYFLDEYADDFGVIVEDFFDIYHLEMTPFIEETANRIALLPDKIKISPNEKLIRDLKDNLKNFGETIKPLDKFSIALGTNNFDGTEKIFYFVRSTAIELFNDKDLIDYPLQITQALEQNFSYLPTLAELIREDIKFLEETKANRPTQAFIDAEIVLASIHTLLDKNLHFEENFELANINFYENHFKPQLTFDLIKALNSSGCKPTELNKLNVMAATIYIKVGNAMTWARRTDLALECFQKALPYAEASGDTELISLARQRVDEWQKIYDDANDSWSSCFWYVLIAFFLPFFLFLLIG